MLADEICSEKIPEMKENCLPPQMSVSSTLSRLLLLVVLIRRTHSRLQKTLCGADKPACQVVPPLLDSEAAGNGASGSTKMKVIEAQAAEGDDCSPATSP